ncbi:MAG: tryptophan--tRNA ligase [Candidatus Magasanikbacteria bacterium CG10_big_fil_rev_8_21_14_0_10_43_6]|uniref:Tryptophan--tRNA ligase n=1 Tax=Candidatus Magasanikbacteria bacterium CG10_big_fil_rev_8_21_14_0_10_43_6 TaxID=1974650 RepID=A0A2M6W1F8_9BACT|nr:MAG: tryptophan--tRNA ligase [Candidatus Magasanikbacteria bacterium CG10_big_fil_rev_8_21_14_0_10_43_6]
MGKPIIFSGIQPTGNLHIGNYLGAVKNWVALQNSGDYHCYFCIVDYHSITGERSPEERRTQIIGTGAELIAAGIDPEKSTLFVQSHIPEHTELAWVFNSVTPLGELFRMTQFKEKGKIYESEDLELDLQLDAKTFREHQLQAIRRLLLENYKKELSKSNVGLLTYPVLQAADILLYGGTHVPVGEDQVQHIELTRDIARWFNNKYGVLFPETQALLTDIPRVKSLLEPTKKMSKSLGLGHVIELADEPAVIEKKLKKAVTASEGGAMAPGVENLLLLLAQFGEAKAHAAFVAAEKDGSIRYGDLKQAVAEAIGGTFTAFRTRRAALLENHNEIADILIAGAHKAQEVARETMAKVRSAIGVR